MEAYPPSYGQATAVNAWDIVAEYISSSDLRSAALVCRRWHVIFILHLWGNPASHFGHENDRVYIALTRFKRTLPWARLAVRSLTHTLHLPPAHAEIYNGPHSDWVREVLERLPNLQSLIVRDLPFFDHAALNALKYTRIPGRSNGLVPAQTPFGLRLLDASRCGNVTASGLHQALRRFDSLIYLDLSWTKPARDADVLRTLGRFSGLQVLKLRGVSLRDEDVEILARGIRTRVRSLDVRNNQLTDRSVRVLLDMCFTLPPRRFDGDQVSSPSLLPYLGAEMLSIYRGAHFEAFLKNEFTVNFVSRLAIEDVPESGITHLYIADNHLTVEGLSGLLRSGRLHVLDAGTVEPELVRHPSFGLEDDSINMTFPGVEKLAPVLTESASHSLTYLRIDHSLITNEPPNSNEEHVIPGRAELADTSGTPTRAAELDGNDQVYELPENNDPSLYELPADPIYIVVSQPTGEEPNPSEKGADVQKVHRSSLDAPELFQPGAPEDCTLHIVSVEEQDDASKAKTNPNLNPSFRGRDRSYSSVITERKNRVKAHLTQSKGFHPGMLPHLSTLVLTKVPATSPTPETSNRIISFIHECAEETTLAKLQARLDWTTPPGRRRHRRSSQANMTAQKQLGREVFALEQLVLEVVPDQQQHRKQKNNSWSHKSVSKSLTQDRDTETFWSAAENDFSFFGESEICGLQEGTFSSSSSRKNHNNTASTSTTASSSSKLTTGPQIDVISEISKFRKARKSVYEERLKSCNEEEKEKGLEIDGFWNGNVKVVRLASSWA